MSANANFSRPSPEETRDSKTGDPKDVIPASDLSPLQRRIDISRLKALDAGLLIQVNYISGKSEVAEDYFAPSLQEVTEVKTENGGHRYVAIGGWVMRSEARSIIEAYEPSPVTPIPLTTEQPQPLEAVA
jgi:hypothetical protein